jgi:glutathione S-transferase
MKLFCFPRSPYSKKVLLALHEKELLIEDKEIVPPYDAGAMQRMRESQEQPLATVPLMRLDDGTYLGDSSLIVEYINLKWPGGTALLPSEPMAALRVKVLDRFADHLLIATVHLTWAMRAANPKRDRIDESLKTVRTVLGTLDRELVRTAFVGGDKLSLGDFAPAAGIATLLRDQSIDGIDEYINVKRWFQVMTSRPSWSKLLEDIARTPSPF